ncbi:hypothetical protein [Parasporobacterium paucivorans]|uniref:Uncharacterized protein n=1 Tax=Parasporobacterium paucivorans DSM 15970 TaxID=1122934 RepID=A0A1M6B6X4_9FIRM|nr:hypothetical protein [Parasporobacterium paucivorans]SHI44338.1 hypothetical protein SAMN02745691_00273 [Parasporobacterium paucivorans DSM 15970]
MRKVWIEVKIRHANMDIDIPDMCDVNDFVIDTVNDCMVECEWDYKDEVEVGEME